MSLLCLPFHISMFRRCRTDTLLEDVLHQDACHHAHRRWQAGSAHALPLQGPLVNVGCHHQRRSTLRGKMNEMPHEYTATIA